MSVLLVTLLLTAVDPGASPSAPAPAEKPRAEKKICRVDTNDSSSRLRKRVCMTQPEWERRDAGVDVGDLKTKGAR